MMCYYLNVHFQGQKVKCFHVSKCTTLSFPFICVSYSRACISEKLLHCHVKVKFPVTGSVVAQWVGRGIALLFHDHGTRRG